MNANTLEQVREILSEQLGCEPALVQPETLLVEGLGMDSLDHVEVLMAFEDFFSTEIADEEVEHIKSVKQIVDLIDKRGAK